MGEWGWRRHLQKSAGGDMKPEDWELFTWSQGRTHANEIAPRENQEAGQSWKKLMISHTPDCPKPLSLLTTYLDSASGSSSYAPAHHASPALISFCSASLPSSFLPQGLRTCYSSYIECLPSPIPYLHDWFICSQVSVKYHSCLSCLKQPSASHSVTLHCFSVFTALITCWNNLVFCWLI